MEPADSNRDSRFPKRSRDVKRARVLVRLNADQRDQAEARMTLEAGKERGQVDAGIGLIDSHDLDVDIGPKHLPFSAIGGYAINGGERVGRNYPAPPADHVSLVVIVRWFDQGELKATPSGHVEPSPE
jgi:hypothetical protein